jgi:hypothetical protein
MNIQEIGDILKKRMIIGSYIKKLIYNKLKEMEIEESKIQEIIKFIADIMDKCWVKMV